MTSAGPFSTRIIGLYPGNRTAVIVYSLNVLPLALISQAMTRHAYAGDRLVEASFDPAEIHRHLVFGRRGIAVFFACLIASVLFPAAFFPIWFLGFLGRGLGRRVWKIS